MIRRLISAIARQFARYKKHTAKPEENPAVELSRIVIPIDCHNDLEAYVREMGS